MPSRFSQSLFPRERSLVGMIHVGALPGTPGSKASVSQIVETAVSEAKVLAAAGFDGLIIENMHDVPYVHGEHGPETTAMMTRVALAVREATKSKLPIGVQVLSGGNKEALAISLTASNQGGADAFIRCENFVFAHVADEGILTRAEAGPLLRYRRVIGAEKIQIWCDIKKKHASHALTADISLADAAEAAIFFGADALIVTGTATGKPTRLEDVAEVRAVCDAAGRKVSVAVGSGVTPENLQALFEYAEVLIVGSFIKRGGNWANRVDPKRCEQIVRAAGRR